MYGKKVKSNTMKYPITAINSNGETPPMLNHNPPSSDVKVSEYIDWTNSPGRGYNKDCVFKNFLKIVEKELSFQTKDVNLVFRVFEGEDVDNKDNKKLEEKVYNLTGLKFKYILTLDLVKYAPEDYDKGDVDVVKFLGFKGRMSEESLRKISHLYAKDKISGLFFSNPQCTISVSPHYGGFNVFYKMEKI